MSKALITDSQIANQAGFFLLALVSVPIIDINNTPQAYPAARCGDAQTGGLLFWGCQYAL